MTGGWLPATGQAAWAERAGEMTLLRRALLLAPATTVALLSASALAVGALFLEGDGRLVLFYLVGLPYYLVSLLASVIAVEFGIESGRWVAVAIVLGTDVLLNALRVATRRMAW